MLNKLKSQKGITLISLIVYVIVMIIVVTIIGTISSYFYANVNEQYQESKDINGESTLDMYLTNDFKNEKVSIEIKSEDSSQVILTYTDNSYVVYTITDNGIYRNNVKIYNIDENDDYTWKFTIGEPISSNSNGIIREKQEVKIEKIKQGQDNIIFKSYIVNIETKAIYPTIEPTT